MLVKFNVVERKNLLDKTVAPKFFGHRSLFRK